MKTIDPAHPLSRKALAAFFRRAGRPLVCLAVLALLAAGARAEELDVFMADVGFFASVADRRTGTEGAATAARYIEARFRAMGHGPVGVQTFDLPVLHYEKAALTLAESGLTLPLFPLEANAVSPGAALPEEVKGPLVYGGDGSLSRLNGKPLEGAIVVLEMASGKSWQRVADLGAAAVVYLGRGPVPAFFFSEKFEITPMDFPRFWMPLDTLEPAAGAPDAWPMAGGPLVSIEARVRWEPALGENVYCLIEGKDPGLKEELIVIEAFYDTRAHVPGHSPGADAACGIATLFAIGDALKLNPPGRSVLLLATSGSGQALYGMREAVWSFRASTRELRQMERDLDKTRERADRVLQALAPNGVPVSFDEPGAERRLSDPAVWEAIGQEIKNRVDAISVELMRLRLEGPEGREKDRIQALAAERMFFRQMGWRTDFEVLGKDDRGALNRLVGPVVAGEQAASHSAARQLEHLRSTQALRRLFQAHEPVAIFSLHLSSHGDGVGAFHQGWLYRLKPTINRTAAYARMDEALKESAEAAADGPEEASLLRDTLRPSRKYSWQNWFLDRPELGGEVSSMAGFTGLTLATTHDARESWGTPFDTPEAMDVPCAIRQSRFVAKLFEKLAGAPDLISRQTPDTGFSTVTGRARFLRHGELFPERPAPGTVVLAYQGDARFYAWVGPTGQFVIKGLADKTQVFDKLIVEGYRFHPESGRVEWAIHKKKTGKDAYRLKIQNRTMETDLIMFACRQSTLFHLLEPRTFRHLTKIHLLDARVEAAPLAYWWSRIDSRISSITSLYLESGTPFKLVLSDTVVRKKMILTHADPVHPEGKGYRVDAWPVLHRTEWLAARDMWSLLAPRIDNLERRGIVDERIREMRLSGEAALSEADKARAERRYDTYQAAASASWALASRVYDHVERVQKDVLFGVLFYIALFVPFAFCVERLVFSFTDIYRRILAFLGILVALIAVIYQVHPAFRLAYSPLVVILAFFIIGLSFLVSLILFLRFEAEMSRLQQRARHLAEVQIGRWKAFTAAFFLGVSNLRRRRIRTLLTIVTLVILTFTIMSFTSVKTTRRHHRVPFLAQAPYTGFLIKNVNWQDLPTEALDAFDGAFGPSAAPRVWFQDPDRTRSTPMVVRRGERVFEAQGLMGLSFREPSVTGLDAALTAGRWFEAGESRAILVSEPAARALGIDPGKVPGAVVTLHGMAFDVTGIFSPALLEGRTDLDAEPLTPAIFPREASMEMTEVEAEALESGEDVKTFQSRYQHLPAELTVILPHEILLAVGGKLKALAVKDPGYFEGVKDLADRFGLTLFSGESAGVFVYHASDALSYSGMPNILVPVLISVFIVLNTMIGSVYERKREIAIYTSVGLAPSHVAFLFIAESMAFAVISVVSGYLLAQVSAGLFSGTALWEGITVNYSSLAGVAAMALVMGVVLVSALYPARVASRIAIPDVNRSWTLPEAKGNTLSVTLPFLMRAAEAVGVARELVAYFEGHQDVTHGTFSTGDIRYPVPEPSDGRGDPALEGCFWLKARVWLAPFDFGVVQQVSIVICPSEAEPGYLEIQVTLERESGEINLWRRINRGFLHHIRRQLLAWRSTGISAAGTLDVPGV